MSALCVGAGRLLWLRQAPLAQHLRVGVFGLDGAVGHLVVDAAVAAESQRNAFAAQVVLGLDNSVLTNALDFVGETGEFGGRGNWFHELYEITGEFPACHSAI